MGQHGRRISSFEGGMDMEARVGELRWKEVINVADGSRYGFVGDVEVELESGQVRAIIVPGRLRLLGLLGREPERVFPWSAVKRFGEDLILVEEPPQLWGEKRRTRR